MARDSWEIYFSRLFPASVSCLLLMSDSCRLISSCWVEGVCTSRAALGLACRYCLCLTKALNCWRWWGAVLLPQTTSECWGLTGQTAWYKIKVPAKKFRSGLMISPLSPPFICPRGPLLISHAIFPVQLLGHPVCVNSLEEHVGVQPDQWEADPVLSQGCTGQAHDRLLPHRTKEGQRTSGELVCKCSCITSTLKALHMCYLLFTIGSWGK